MESNASAPGIERARGIGPQRARILDRIGIRTINDALLYLPRRYDDRSNLCSISSIQEGHFATIRGTVIASAVKPLRRGLRIFELTVNDGTGLIRAKWFNQPFLKRNFRIGQDVILSGTAKRNPYAGGLELDGPEYETVEGGSDDFIHANRIVPVYRLTEGISQKQFRKIMFNVVGEYAGAAPDTVPPGIINRCGLPPLAESIREVHFPEKFTETDSLNQGDSIYRRRLSFHELFLFELGMAVMRKGRGREPGHVIQGDGSLRTRLIQLLPYRLTEAQERVVSEILCDMESPYPMHRLIQGDVGCGKTVVALMAMLNAIEGGFQAALMAPTEILAEQHFINIHGLVRGLGLDMELVTGSPRKRRTAGISGGQIPLVVGTHALIQEGIAFKRLGLAVIDEQHKFGVVQRALLRKKGEHADVLVMTATPIPRSLALTVYGDLDCSVIDQLPPGRRPVETRVFSASQKDEIYGIMTMEISAGRQAYVVYPAIEESDATGLKAAVQGREGFQRIFPDLRVALLHGRMSTQEKEEVMAAFTRGEVHILVATTVIEVGVDVANATVMVIVHAERFGLSQLHQLRGRVGRGAEKSCCLLVAYEPAGEDSRRRLEAMIESGDGFRIAEEDLDIRGPGEFFGTRQAGLPDLRVADLARDRQILETAKREAFSLIDESPDLRDYPDLRRDLEVFWQGKIELFMTA